MACCCRFHPAHRVLHPDSALRPPKLRDPPCGVPLRPDHDLLARQHRRGRHLQHRSLESERAAGPLPTLYHQILQDHGERRVDVPRRNRPLRHRYLVIFLFLFLFSFFFFNSDLWCVVACGSFAGAEAMFADLGHFSKTSIRVRRTLHPLQSPAEGQLFPSLILMWIRETENSSIFDQARAWSPISLSLLS